MSRYLDQIYTKLEHLNEALGSSNAELGAIALAAVFAFLAVLFAILRGRARRRWRALERDYEALRQDYEALRETHESLLQRLRKHAARVPMLLPRYVNVIVLGPRNSGKSSIVKLWAKPGVNIKKYDITTSWTVYEKEHRRFAPENRPDKLVGTERKVIPVLRLRIHDYPGEDTYREVAIKDLAKLAGKVVILCVMRIEFEQEEVLHTEENADYFSRTFNKMVLKHVTDLKAKVAKVIVVFNKVDLLPGTWGDAEALRQLKKANMDALNQINRVFRDLISYEMVSAWTNKGIVTLEGSVGEVGVDL
jgi:hypothetical protein